MTSNQQDYGFIAWTMFDGRPMVGTLKFRSFGTSHISRIDGSYVTVATDQTRTATWDDICAAFDFYGCPFPV